MKAAVIMKLQEAIALKTEIAKQEVRVWQAVSKALSYLERNPDHVTTQESGPRLQVKNYLSVNETIKYLGISRTMLYRLKNEGAIKHMKLGRSTRFRTVDIDAYAASRII